MLPLLLLVVDILSRLQTLLEKILLSLAPALHCLVVQVFLSNFFLLLLLLLLLPSPGFSDFLLLLLVFYNISEYLVRVVIKVLEQAWD